MEEQKNGGVSGVLGANGAPIRTDKRLADQSPAGAAERNDGIEVRIGNLYETSVDKAGLKQPAAGAAATGSQEPAAPVRPKAAPVGPKTPAQGGNQGWYIAAGILAVVLLGLILALILNRCSSEPQQPLTEAPVQTTDTAPVTTPPPAMEPVQVSPEQLPYTQIGNVVTYGHYEQDSNWDNGKEPIEWIVLDYDAAAGKSLLLSKYGLECHSYHSFYNGNTDPTPYPTWAKSDVRMWLNGEFRDEAFTIREQTGIVAAQISTPDHAGISGGIDTLDQIWLLSREEVERYLTADRECIVTEYCYEADYFMGASTRSTCTWWLRSPGDSSTEAACVRGHGAISSGEVDIYFRVVRPAFWIDLDAVSNQMPIETAPAELSAAEKARQACTEVGNTVTYGHYEQDNNIGNGKEPIEWIVLDYDEATGASLLLSKYGLASMQFHGENWENSGLRAWMNEDFLYAAFTDGERAGILLTDVDNSASQGCDAWNPASRSTTQDRVFALSCAQARWYFGVSPVEAENMGARCAATAYAETTGAGIDNEFRTEEGRDAGWWWLRSPGDQTNHAASVSFQGVLRSRNYDSASLIARPAIWLNLNTAAFN